MSQTTRINLSAGKLAAAVLVLVVLATFWTAFYSVPADSEAVVLRFGKYFKTETPGLKFKMPLGVDDVYIVPVKRQMKVEFGYATQDSLNPFQHALSLYPRGAGQAVMQAEKDMVTGDLNSAWVEWVVQYHVGDPKQYLFSVRSPEITLRDAAESVMREVVGDRTVDEVLTFGRQKMEIEALAKMQQLMDGYKIGFKIDQVQLKNVNPPTPVKDSFDEVNRAEAEKEETVNLARREYNSVVPKAEGEAKQKIAEAEGYALKRKNEAEGDTSRFSAMFKEYAKAPEVTRRRLYLETLAEVLPGVGKMVIVDDEAGQVLPLLNLNGKGEISK